MSALSRNQIISYLILLLWLLIRISGAVSTSNLISNWHLTFYGVFLFGSFALIAVVIILNRDDLQRLNMDGLYLILLLIAAILGLYELPYNCFSGIALIYLVYALLRKRIKLGVPDQSAFRISLWIVGLFAVILLLSAGFLNMPKIEQNLQYFVLELVPGSIFEEAFYRGLLFMFLKDLRLSESKIFYIQVFLFWISHIDSLLSRPLAFLIFIPILGLVLGYIALRTKSIGLSAVAHILINLISASVSLSLFGII